ncbi:hypothetical protein LTR56_012168 [Elasticomyces elasticus]|nr:hypothetical protein LTR56_012168 [Elasticomyces elasticus]KAK3663627.1 hypothetical protein LTR22_005569 [Elasticomyces elasticus]KAK4921747.1 hypothetical protein LTR49_010855 [Elasticomyces elasticus]KAK5764177.1 hypothetical protein LTS12_005626 [Elasticomyces elasticus]
MCGIWCAVTTHDHIHPNKEIQQLLERRGPDSSCSTEFTLSRETHSGESQTVYTTVHSTVLALRGDTAVKQPFGTATGATLCWNGEAWEIAGERPVFDNDTVAVAKLLDGVVTRTHSSHSNGTLISAKQAELVAEAMAQISGPYAFVFYDPSNGMLYFGRDFLGRRSLLWRTAGDGELLLSSVAGPMSPGDEHPWTEVEADGLYYVDLASPYGCDDVYGSVQKVPYRLAELATHIGTRVVPRLSLNKDLPSSQTRLHSASSAVNQLEVLLRSSLRRRLENVPGSKDAIADSNLAVLFSGGLDCTVLARLAHECYPEHKKIDLLNVAFENPRIHKADSDAYELCPDRITGRASHAELMRVCPERDWVFIAINIPYIETLAHRQRIVDLMYPHDTEMDLSIATALCFAARGTGVVSSTVDNHAPPFTTTTNAKVLLSGLGADELFGGYQRHTTAFNRKGCPGLLDELDLDVSRLGKRNLGRDDRVISNWAREARFPFLDEDVVAWAMAASVDKKCGFGEPQASAEDADGSDLLEPEKKVLRCLAWKLDMKLVAKEKKRAVGAPFDMRETSR